MNKPSFATISSWPRLPVQRRARGFSLIELLVAMAITAVLLSVAIPSFGTIINSIKLSSASSAFLAHLHLARSEAIKRNSRVVLCKSANSLSCTPLGGWEQGWIVFHDSNNNGTRDPGEIIIERVETLPSKLRLTGNLNVERYVSFAPSGATKLVTGAFQAGTLTFCHESMPAGEGHQIILNAVGRPRIQKVTVNACV